jgi:hypothetical protein
MSTLHVSLATTTDNPTVNSRSRRRAPVFAVLGVLLTLSASALAAETSPAVAGSWKLAQSAVEKEQRLEAINQATRHLRPMQRDMVRDRLAERTSPPASLQIEIEGSKLMMSSGENGFELELGAPPVEVPASDGTARASAKMAGDELVFTADGGNGQRTTTYRADGDRLTAEVTMTGARLDQPVTYSTTYLRAQ